MQTFSTGSLAAAAVALAFAATAAASQATRPASPATQSKPAATSGVTRPANTHPAASTARPAASAVRSAVGTIAKYDANTLTLKTASGEEQFAVASSTRLREGARPIKADALPGMTGKRAKVRYSEANGRKTAQSVMVSRKGGHAKSRG